MNRCSWCGTDGVYVKYHDEHWGVPVYDSKELFAKLILDGAQAGLSWITILKKQEGYYKAFDGLDPEKMALYGEDKIQELEIETKKAKTNSHYTSITLFGIEEKMPIRRGLGKVKRHLASIYRDFFKKGILDLYINGEKLSSSFFTR